MLQKGKIPLWGEYFVYILGIFENKISKHFWKAFFYKPTPGLYEPFFKIGREETIEIIFWHYKIIFLLNISVFS